MAEFAALPLFTDAWIADTGHLTRLERGIYMDLLILMWRSPECRVPNDLRWIARRLRVEESEMQTLCDCIEEFCTSDGNWITQKRLTKEWRYTQLKRRKNIASAKSRWKKEKEASERINDAVQAQSEGNAPSPSPSPTLEKKEPKGSFQKKATRLAQDWSLPDPWRDWATDAGLTATQVREQAERFRDYWAAKPGKDAAKLDWQATWRNWCRKAIEDAKPKPRHRPASPEWGDERTLKDGTVQQYRGAVDGWVKVMQ